jgi:transposase InsO family protein
VSRFRFVDDHRDTYEVKRLCEAVDVSRQGYYAWRNRPASPRAVADAELLEEIRPIHTDSRCTYGAPRVHGQLHRRGHQIGCKRVARLMRAAMETFWSTLKREIAWIRGSIYFPTRDESEALPLRVHQAR